LLAAIRRPADFAPLYDRYVEPIYRYCFRRVSNPDFAADLTSVIFTRAIEALPRFRPNPNGGTFRSWLFTIAHNVVVDAYRSQHPPARCHPIHPTTIPARKPGPYTTMSSPACWPCSTRFPSSIARSSNCASPG
jgi:RNA polymerase sigma-70 factor (ECF subfamily)